MKAKDIINAIARGENVYVSYKHSDLTVGKLIRWENEHDGKTSFNSYSNEYGIHIDGIYYCPNRDDEEKFYEELIEFANTFGSYSVLFYVPLFEPKEDKMSDDYLEKLRAHAFWD